MSPVLESVQPKRVPRRFGGVVAYKALPAEVALAVDDIRRKRHLVIRERLVLRRAPDLDDLEPVRALEHSVPNSRRLQHAIARTHDELRTLVFVHETDPTFVVVDHLKADLVEVNVVRHRTAFRNLDVRSDEAPAQTTGDEIAVAHSGAPDAPLGPFVLGHDERLLHRRHHQWRIDIDDLDAGSVRRGKLGRAISNRRRIAAQQTDRAWLPGTAAL